MYCEKSTVMRDKYKFDQALKEIRSKSELIFTEFTRLSLEVAQLDKVDQVIFYANIACLLREVLENENDYGGAIDSFMVKCYDKLYGKYPFLKTLGLGLAVVAIALSAVAMGAALGLGIGMLMGLWSAPMGFLSSLLALQTPAVLVASASAVVGVAAAAYSAYSFFKESGIEKALRLSVDAIKQSALSERLQARNDAEGFAKGFTEDNYNQRNMEL